MPVSYSQLASFRSCPRQYEYEFVKKLTKPLTPEGCFGVSIHSALAKWGKKEMRKCDKCENIKMQKQLFEDVHSPAQEIELTCDVLLALWQTSFVTAGYDTLVAADFDRKRGEKLLMQFYEWWKKEERKVIGVEKSFKLRLLQCENVQMRKYESDVIAGRFDRVEELSDGTLRVIDFKTSRMRSQEEIDQDLQLSVYALAGHEELKKEVSELVMLFLVDESVTEVVTRRGEGELRTAAKTIELLSERIFSGDYSPTPSREKCRRCPFKRICDVAAV